jgi:hypothetical protein
MLVPLSLASACTAAPAEAPTDAGNDAPDVTIDTTVGSEPSAAGPVDLDRPDFQGVTFALAPSLEPALFVGCVDNPHFPLIPGTVYHFEERTDEGLETVTITVTNQTRTILGIPATVVHDVVQLDGAVKEDTLDWHAQDDRGNVWYFGEDTKEVEDGEVVSTGGSWEAGVDGATPGIIMPGNPRPGDRYREEYYAGEAEDMGGIVSLAEAVTVAAGTFDRALQTAAYNPLDDNIESKWYAAGIGLVREAIGGETTVELVRVTHDPAQADAGRGCGATGGVGAVPELP